MRLTIRSNNTLLYRHKRPHRWDWTPLQPTISLSGGLWIFCIGMELILCAF